MSDSVSRPPGVRRRSLLRTTGVAGGLLVGWPFGHLAGHRPAGAARASAITEGTSLVYADLHNHSQMSDGIGDPLLAFASMRSAGLDVAALTDHSTPGRILDLSPAEWRHTGHLADAADDPGTFTALRGFEWSHDHAGHLNVWFTDELTDPDEHGDLDRLYDWLATSPGISGFNHPGRQRDRFDDFRYVPALRERMVGLEMFNQRDDYLFDGWAQGRTSPLNACLNAGWRTGLTGMTDEHGTDWGFSGDKGRTGLWVTANTRAGVLAAMRARRFFATRVSGLRLDATAAGVRMGGDLPFARGAVKFAVDLDRGSSWAGRPLHLQVLRPGARSPEVAAVIPAECGRVTEFTVPLDGRDGTWVVLRVSDPAQANGSPGPLGHPCNDWAAAYSSPWWLAGGTFGNSSGRRDDRR
jgi:uncharacterized protein DUF3604